MTSLWTGTPYYSSQKGNDGGDAVVPPVGGKKGAPPIYRHGRSATSSSSALNTSAVCNTSAEGLVTGLTPCIDSIQLSNGKAAGYGYHEASSSYHVAEMSPFNILCRSLPADDSNNSLPVNFTPLVNGKGDTSKPSIPYPPCQLHDLSNHNLTFLSLLSCIHSVKVWNVSRE